MHVYKSLLVVAVDAGERPFINLTMRNGSSAENSCTASKSFPLEQWGEVRDILGWASHAFLSAAEELSEDGWEFRHTAECAEAHLVVADA